MTKGSHDVSGWVAAPIIAVVLFAVPLPAWMIERIYSRGIYLWWQGWITSLSNLAPFALLDVLIAGAVIAVFWRGAALWRMARGVGVLTAVSEGLRRLVRAAGVVGIVFLLMWGLNYRRVPLDQVLPRSSR